MKTFHCILSFLLIPFAFLYPQWQKTESDGIRRALEIYKDKFYIWQQPENQNSNSDSILTVLGRWAWGPCNAVDAENGIAYVGNGPTLHLLDISSPSDPQILGEFMTEGYIYDIEVKDNAVFICIGSGLLILDVSDPVFPEELSFIGISGVAISFALEDSFAYVTTFSGYMKVVDISDLYNPYLRGIIPTLAELAECVEAKDGYVYIGSPELPYMQIVNATNPDSLDESFFNSEGRGISSFIKDTLLFIGSSWYSTYLKIFDISNLAVPEFVGHVEIEDSILIDGITVSEDGLTAYALCLTSSARTFTEGIYSIDISDLSQPVILDKFERATQVGARGISISQNTLVASYFSGLSVIDITNPNSLEFQSFFPTGGFASKIQLKDSLAFVASGLSGLWILDVSNPYKPESISNVNTGSTASDLVVEDTLAYIVNWAIYTTYVGGDTSRGLWIIDISNIYEPEILSHYIGITNPSSHVVPNSITKSGNLILITQAPTATSSDMMEIINVSNPFEPSGVGIFQGNFDPYDIAVNDTIVYLATSGGGLKIIDISNPVNPTEISNTLNSATGVTFQNPYVYTSTSIFSIINVDDPKNPFVISSISTHSSSWSVDLSILGDYAYWADRELGVIDISNPEFPIQLTTFLGKDAGRGVAALADKIFFEDQTQGVWILKNGLIASVKDKDPVIIPKAIELYQNYPNPFNSQTRIDYYIGEETRVIIKIFDVLGRKIKTLVNDFRNAGSYEIDFDASEFPSGVYFYKLQTENYFDTKKMILLK